MPGMFSSSGGGKLEFPEQKDVLETRYPEAIGLESELRDYFRGLLSQPNLGYKGRQTYDPMQMYLGSLGNRQTVTDAAVGRQTPALTAGNDENGVPRNGFAALMDGLPAQAPRTMPDFGSTIGQSRATRPLFPATREEYNERMGEDADRFDKGWAHLIPNYVLSGQVRYNSPLYTKGPGSQRTTPPSQLPDGRTQFSSYDKSSIPMGMRGMK